MYSGGKYVFANKSMVRIFGFQMPEELIGKQHLDLIHPQYSELVQERMTVVLTDDSGKHRFNLFLEYDRAVSAACAP